MKVRDGVALDDALKTYRWGLSDGWKQLLADAIQFGEDSFVFEELRFSDGRLVFASERWAVLDLSEDDVRTLAAQLAKNTLESEALEVTLEDATSALRGLAEARGVWEKGRQKAWLDEMEAKWDTEEWGRRVYGCFRNAGVALGLGKSFKKLRVRSEAENRLWTPVSAAGLAFFAQTAVWGFRKAHEESPVAEEVPDAV